MHCFFDKRKTGAKGLALSKNLASLGLKIGDRVCQSAEMRDIGLIFDLVPPYTVTFWRPSRETLARRRLPVWCPHLGFDITSITVDPMHTLHLGLLQRFCSYVFWNFLLANVYNVPFPTEDELILLGLARMRAELYGWYSGYKAMHPGITELSDFTRKTLGEKGKWELKCKAAATRPLFSFCLHLLRKYPNRCPGHDAVLANGEAMYRILEIWREQGDVPTQAAQKDVKFDMGNSQ